MDVAVEDIDFIGLEKLSKPGAYHEIECAAGIVLDRKGVAPDELEFAETKRA
jgi:hypothetical protein